MDKKRWQFAQRHMPEIKRVISNLPAKVFFNLGDPTFKQDTEQATDLVLNLTGGNMAVRVRTRKQYDAALQWGFDWSVRSYANGYRNEIEKLKQGYVRFYFIAFSADDAGTLAAWWLLDVDRVLAQGILDKKWKRYKNNDNTEAMYIPVRDLEKAGCVIRQMAG
jgi:hypothetical protein